MKGFTFKKLIFTSGFKGFPLFLCYLYFQSNAKITKK